MVPDRGNMTPNCERSASAEESEARTKNVVESSQAIQPVLQSRESIEFYLNKLTYSDGRRHWR